MALRELRGIMAAGLALAACAPAVAAPAAAGRVEFEVLREGQHFGKQGVTVSHVNGDLVAESSADLKAGLGPLTMFHYTQQCRETWRGGALVGLKCSTLKDGKKHPVEAAVGVSGLQVSGPKGRAEFPAAALPTAWWTRPPVGTYEMINTETGEKLPVVVSRVGRETIDAGNGVKIDADHVRVAGTLTVDLWYDDAGHWVSCAFKASGQRMTYRLLTSPSEAPS